MAALPTNGTARFWIDYISGANTTSREHTVMWRYNPAVASEDVVMTKFLAVLTALGTNNFYSQWKVLRCRKAAAGQDFSVPVNPIAGLAAFRGTAAPAYNARYECVEDSFQFRSMISGRRGDFSLYCARGDCDQNFRIAMPAPVMTAIVDAMGAGALIAIDGTVPGLYTYINQNYNSYWESRSRTG